ncbi:MAG: HAMP domain-containing sensor histidine kinase [Acidimicrobiales bacterium]
MPERRRSRFDWRPLDRISSVRMKFAIVIVLAVGVAAVVSQIGLRLGIPVILRPVIAMAISLVFVRFVAHGLTAPLREMEAAATRVARGEYDQWVRDSARDEVGRLATAFNTMAAELAEADRQRRDLIANVSHELRTPLSALQAKLENIVDGVEPADPDELRLMLVQTERLSRLVAQLLDLSRLESGASPLHTRRVPVADLLGVAADEGRLLRDDLDLRVAVQPAGLAVEADPERFHQVVANLVANAARHSPPGGAVDLSGRLEGGRVVIEVADDGPGIPVEERGRVFERFYRADRARAADRGGAGLGLAIARWIVDLHGGQIRAEDRTPHGCRMVIELPA